MLRHRFLWIVGSALLACTPSLDAQTTTGTVRGYVKDQNGAAIPDVEVSARNTQSGVTRTNNSRADGSYILLGLVPGNYELSVRKIGFGPQHRQATVLIGATLLVDFTLQAGAVELQAVTVEAAPGGRTRPSETTPNVTQKALHDLPTAKRDHFGLSAVGPSVITQDDQ